jgi:hypothetical protein
VKRKLVIRTGSGILVLVWGVHPMESAHFWREEVTSDPKCCPPAVPGAPSADLERLGDIGVICAGLGFQQVAESRK